MSDSRQIERLYSHSYFSYLATFVAAVLVYWAFSDISQNNVLNIWFIAFTVVTLLRTGFTWWFNRRDPSGSMDFWLVLFLVMSAISGTMWGLTGFLLVPSDSLSQLDSVLYHGLLLLFVITLITGSIITYSGSRSVYLSFSIPAIVPQCLMLIARGDHYHSFLGGVVLAYASFMFVLSMYIYRMFSVCAKVEV